MISHGIGFILNTEYVQVLVFAMLFQQKLPLNL